MEEVTEFKKLPVEERVVHKLWKARVHGYEELTKLFRQIDDEKSPEFAKYLGLMKKFVVDSNAMGQEKGLEATLAYIENYANAGKTVGEVMSGIVAKCIAAARTKTRELSVQVILMYVEIEKQEAVQEELLKGMDLKNPKIVAACISVTTLALHEFGSKVINVKPLIKKMHTLLSDRDKTIRDESKAMVIEIFRWIGNALRSQMSTLQAVQVTELETEFAKLGSGKVIPTRYLRSQQGRQAKIAAEAGDQEDGNEDNEPDAPPELDPYDLADPVSILAKLPSDFYEKLEAKKWQERKEAVEVVENLVKAPKLENGDYGDLVRALKKIISKDSNVMVVAIAGKCLAGLASGLKKRFQPYAGACIPALLEKFREKKQNVVLALREALDAIFNATTLESIVEDVTEALNNKNPAVKAETASFLARAFTRCQPAALNKKMLKAYTGVLQKTLNEPDLIVRDNSAEALGTAMKLVGEKAINPFMVEVDKLKMEKIKEFCDKAVIVAKVAGPKKERPVTAPSKTEATPAKATTGAPKAVKRPTSAGIVVKKKPVTATAASKSKGKVAAKQSTEQEMTAEEISDKASEDEVRGNEAPFSVGKPAASRKKDDDVDTSPLLMVNNLKHQRVIDEQKLKVLKWNFVTPREEFVELLKDQMAVANVNKTLMSNMFHVDFRYHLKAIESLTDDIPGNSSALISNLDLILKWLTLRFFDTNPSVLLKGLEYLQVVFAMLIQSKHLLLENEASSFVPYLILKVGDPKDAVRNGVKSLFKQIVLIYPVSRLFSYIMEGLNSKNARQRTACLDELGSLIEGYGISVCQPTPVAAMKEVAKHISDRDNSVRNAALNCIVNAFFLEGEKIYKMVGQISDKDLSLLEERIKRASKKAGSNRQSRIVVAPQAPIPSADNTMVMPSPTLSREASDLDQKSDEEQEIAPAPVLTSPRLASPENINTITAIMNLNLNSANQTIILDNNKNPTKTDEDLPLPIKTESPRPSPPRPVSGPFGLDSELLNKLENTPARVRIPQVLEMDLNFLDDPIPCLSEIYNGIPVSAPKRVPAVSPTQPFATCTRPSVSSIASTTNPRVGQELLFEKTINQIASPDLKVALRALKQMEDILQSNKMNLMTEFEDQFMQAVTLQLKLLHSQNLNTNTEVLKIYRALLTILSTFYDSKTLGKQVSSHVLKDILHQLITLLVDTRLENIQSSDAYNRVINLHCVTIIEKSDHTSIICALIKLLHECVNSPRSPRLLDLVMKCCWRVVKIIPSWKDELEYDTILYEIHLFFKEFPSHWWKQRPSDTPSRTVKTILHSMAKIKGNALMAHLGKIPNTNESELQSYLLKVLKTFKLEEVKQIPLKKETKRPLPRPLHNMLTEIFQKIGSKESTKEGLLLLYEFKIQHPEADIQPYLERSSQFFHEYIERGLKDIENSRKSEAAQVDVTVTEATNAQTSFEQAENIQGGGDSKSNPEYWMDRLKMWQKVISGDSSTSPGNTLDNKLKDENLNMQKTMASHDLNIGADKDKGLRSTDPSRKTVESLRKLNEYAGNI